MPFETNLVFSIRHHYVRRTCSFLGNAHRRTNLRCVQLPKGQYKYVLLSGPFIILLSPWNCINRLYDFNNMTCIVSAERPSTNTQDQQLDNFHRLVRELSGYVDTANSLSFSEICDPNAVIQRMKEYQSDRAEWGQYAHEDGNQSFTRNMVERGLGKSNIVC